ncbi:unnamed protein product [Sphagnum jensenii]|uniref:Uncharacterized protein n=1 Tax=Sphagnum jensenii TaxID=128206 RepID=A0ABP1A3C7_9BRYO
MVGGSHRKGVQKQWQISEGEEVRKRGPNQRPSTQNPTGESPVAERPRRRRGQEHSLNGARTLGGLATRASGVKPPAQRVQVV